MVDRPGGFVSRRMWTNLGLTLVTLVILVTLVTLLPILKGDTKSPYDLNLLHFQFQTRSSQ
jgi:hypothetical protein